MKKTIYRFFYLQFPSLWFLWSYGVENAYQTYTFSKYEICPFGETLAKFLTMAPVFRALVHGRTFLELGCDAGYFPLQAAVLGATRSVGIDRNRQALAKAEKTKRRLRLNSVEFCHGVIPDVPVETYDSVLLLSAIHYLFSDKLGNRILFETMDSFVKFLSDRAGTYLLVEFVYPQDQYAQKLVAERFLQSGEYSERSLLAALYRHFDGVAGLGATHRSTRQLFLAYRGEPPLILPECKKPA